jgi:WD40 repeat protein
MSTEYRQAKIIRSHEGAVHSVTIGPGPNGLLATASWDATVHIYDLSRDDHEAFIVSLGAEGPDECDSAMMGGLYGVAFARTDSKIIGCVSADKGCYLWNYQTGKFLMKLEEHDDEVNGLAFHPTQQVMCTCSDDCTAIIWDFQEGLKLRCLDFHEKSVYGATFLGTYEGSAEEYLVATCCFDQKVRIFDMRDKTIVCSLNGHTDDIIGLDYSGSTKRLATGSDDGCICVYDTRKIGSGQKEQMPIFKINSREMPGIQSNEVKRVAFNSNGTKIAAGCSSQQALIYNIGGPVPMMEAALQGHLDCVFDCAWGIDAGGVEYLVDASHDHTSFVWRPMNQ